MPSSTSVQATQPSIVSQTNEQHISSHALPQSAQPVALAPLEVLQQVDQGPQLQDDEKRQQMAAKLISLLPTFVPGPSLAAVHCPVCLDPGAVSPIMMGTYMHPVHVPCLTSWFFKSTFDTYPPCRTDLLAIASS